MGRMTLGPAGDDAGEELLATAAHGLSRRSAQVLGAVVAATALTAGVLLGAAPRVQVGHGSIAASTAQRYRAEHQVSGTPVGNRIRGYFLI
jgi:hypothetical protein